LNDEHTKIITIEDPVEYKLERICQVQVEPKIGLDFARVLRSILRQDPDVVLVGEMRDEETASIAMRAALTGHLVLSTLHTNDSVSTALRLLDMGVAGFLIAATLECVIAQRLMRRNCAHCKKPYELDENEKAWITSYDEKLLNHEYYKGQGCRYCNNIGYSGRIGVYELLIMTEEMLTLLAHEQQDEFKKAGNIELKGKRLVDKAMQNALEGLTSIPEVVRIAGAY
jgi:MSHA biogenesis protein MshE